MESTSQIWLTIFAYMAWAVALSVMTHLWIRHHLKKKNNRNADMM